MKTLSRRWTTCCVNSTLTLLATDSVTNQYIAVTPERLSNGFWVLTLLRMITMLILLNLVAPKHCDVWISRTPQTYPLIILVIAPRMCRWRDGICSLKGNTTFNLFNIKILRSQIISILCHSTTALALNFNDVHVHNFTKKQGTNHTTRIPPLKFQEFTNVDGDEYNKRTQSERCLG